MLGRVLELEVRVNGRSVREYQHGGQVWIEGRKGSEFVLRFRSQVAGRILVVPSVDGLSIMDGKKCSFDSSGYIIGPYGHIDVPGWRLDDTEVAKFIFGKKGGSYAAKSGLPLDVGVIGVAAFFEKVYVRTENSMVFGETFRGGPVRGGVLRGRKGVMTGAGAGGQSVCSTQFMNSGAVMDSMSSGATYDCDVPTTTATSGTAGTTTDWQQAVSQELGTEFGKKHSHGVVSVPFEKASSEPEETLSIRYDSRRNLRKRGVDLDPKPQAAYEPNAFPGEQRCKPPIGWRG